MGFKVKHEDGVCKLWAGLFLSFAIFEEMDDRRSVNDTWGDARITNYDWGGSATFCLRICNRWISEA
jgi:hypothetical protein